MAKSVLIYQLNESVALTGVILGHTLFNLLPMIQSVRKLCVSKIKALKKCVSRTVVNIAKEIRMSVFSVSDLTKLRSVTKKED